jgi:uncharacterized membrane protein
MSTKNQNAIDQPASNSAIQDLYSKGYIDPNTRQEAVKLLCPPPIMWQVWADRMLALFSAALMLAGVVFFFAYNWVNIPSLVKLGLIQVAMLSCIVVTLIKGVEQITGKLFILAASIFLGVLLAVYGQIYQTGADSYQLFVAWSLLMAGWVFVSKFGGLWLMWLILINVSIILYFDQVLSQNTSKLITTLTLVNTFFLSAREYGLYKGLVWLKGKWLRWIILTTVFLFLTCHVIISIFENFHNTNWSIFPPILLLLISLITSYFCRYRSPDLFSLTLVALSISAVISSILAKALIEATGENVIVAFIIGLIVLALMSVSAFILREVDKSIQKEGNNGN